MSNKLLEDSEGNKSSKRLAGIVLVIDGVLMKTTLFIFGLFRALPNDINKLDNIADTCIISGSILLGWGVTEGLIKLIKK
jgi:hypothetical protein